MSEWKKVKIGDFLTEREGRYKPDDSKISKYKRLDKIDFSGTIHISDKPTKTDMIIVHPGDLVISGINVAKGAVAVYQGDEPVCATIHYSSYTFDSSKVDLEYFKYFVKSPAFIAALQKQVKGGIKTEIKPKHLLPLEISIPDLQTQQEIVKKTSLQLKKTEQLSVEIESQKNYIKQLRQNILQQAIEGTLTADWRKQNPVQKGNPNYDAEALFEQIQEEKKYLLATKELKKGNLPKAIRSNKDLLKYPDSWKWARIDDLFFVTKLAGFEFTQYFHLTESGDIPVVRAQNVRDLTLNKSNLLYIDSKTSELLERSALTKPSLLVTFIGAGIGDVGIFEEKERWHLAPNVAKLEPLKNCEKLISIKLVALFMLSSFGQKEIFKYMKATAQPSLSMESIRDICFPLPPLAEQNEIVTRVENHLQTVSDLENQITKREQLTKQLMQSILKDAFEEK